MRFYEETLATWCAMKLAEVFNILTHHTLKYGYVCEADPCVVSCRPPCYHEDYYFLERPQCSVFLPWKGWVEFPVLGWNDVCAVEGCLLLSFSFWLDNSYHWKIKRILSCRPVGFQIFLLCKYWNHSQMFKRHQLIMPYLTFFYLDNFS